MFHISHVCISQKVKGVLMWNLQHIISIKWKFWYILFLHACKHYNNEGTYTSSYFLQISWTKLCTWTEPFHFQFHMANRFRAQCFAPLKRIFGACTLREMCRNTSWNVSKYGVISGAYFPVFELNMEIYSVNVRIQSEYRKILTRKDSVFGHFSRSDRNMHKIFWAMT